MKTIHRGELVDSDQILHTKLIPPHLRSSLVTRDALFARLDEGLERRLTLLSAPAGFGKTTLVSAWIARHSTRAARFPVAWVSLDAGDNDPVRFWRYIITACQMFDDTIGNASLPLLHVPHLLSLDGMLTTFINELTQIQTRCILVLEDYHTISVPQIHEMLSFLLDHLPGSLHLMIITRKDPPLPLARLRAYGDLCELHAADLRFSLAEMQAFLRQALPFALSPEALARLEARTEGWIAGLRLLTLALQGRQDAREAEALLLSFNGSHRHILDYLVADVFTAQPAPLQEFLLQTCFLSRLNASLCDFVTDRHDSEHLLDYLDHANLFLLPLDENGRWYRYHALFAEAMQHEARYRLDDAHVRALFYKASQWYEQHGLFADAVEAALAAQAYERAAALVERCIDPRHFASELHTLRRWIAQLPEEVLSTRPALCMIYAQALLFTSDRYSPAIKALVETPLRMAERYWRAEDNRAKLAEVLAFRSQVAWWQAELSRAFRFARQALEWLPEEAAAWRGPCMLMVSMEAFFMGRPELALQKALDAQVICEIAQNEYAARAAMLLQAETYRGQGELHQAALLYRQVLANAGEDLTDKGVALAGLAALSYEWNELDAAEQSVTQALAFGKQTGDIDLQIRAALIQARLLQARGESEQAQTVLRDLLTRIAQSSGRSRFHEIRAAQARLALANGDLPAVQRWYEASVYSGDDNKMRMHQEQEALLAARLQIARGECQEALCLLEHWLLDAQQGRRGRSEVEILLLMALAHAAHKQHDQARRHLKQALALAHGEGYQRLFLDEKEPLAALLKTVLPELKEEALIDYARTLLSAFTREGAFAVKASPASVARPGLLIEPLSPQERRVLRLLSAGLSNPEIASELVVSVNTVKTQVQSIYRKLAVTSRKEARHTAQQLCLL